MTTKRDSEVTNASKYTETIFSPDVADNEEKSFLPTSTLGLAVGSLIRIWADVSKINYMSTKPLDIVTSVHSILRRRSIGLPAKEYSIQSFVPTEFHIKSQEDLFSEAFPTNVTPLLNEDNLWGCFYTFPEIYANIYSPVIHIRNIHDVREQVGGILTRDMVTACLTYLKRTPILGDYVLIKLDLSTKHLINIDVLQYYKYLVYLDLSSNLLTELTVLSFLPYLQFLSVSFNRLGNVLEYKTPQWFLTEVHYKYNSVKRIRDLTAFWSITILDLSHNNIKCITGLENLRYLRRLDLSFNHIQRLENLNHMRLLWLDVSYNNISAFDFGPTSGLWTLLHLEYLNLNENKLTSLKLFAYCTRLRELHARNNRISMLIEVPLYMRQMRRLIVLDLRANPICFTPGYKEVIVNTFWMLLSLDAAELDPVKMRTLMMEMKPDITSHATRRLLRLLYIQQLAKARVSPYIPPADTTEVPIVVLVGHEGVGKGALARRLAAECSEHIQIAQKHTTATYHFLDHYAEITHSKFDDMLIAGDFLTYTEMGGESYGLKIPVYLLALVELCPTPTVPQYSAGRKEAAINGGKIRIVSMDLLGALMLKLRGYRPYLILTTLNDRKCLAKIQQLRKTYRNIEQTRVRMSLETPLERSTLQVLLSGRIIITGIINEIILGLPDEKEQSEFVIESECSLMMDSDARQAVKDYARGINILALLNSSGSSLEECKHNQENSMEERSLYSLFKESQATDEYNSYFNGQYQQGSYQERFKRATEPRVSRTRHDKHSSISNRFVVQDSSKSSKSVTFTSQDEGTPAGQNVDPTGMMIEPTTEKDQKDGNRAMRSISVPWSTRGQHESQPGSHVSIEDSDLWLAFLTETGFLQYSNINHRQSSDTIPHQHIQAHLEEDSIMRQMLNDKVPTDFPSTNIRDTYETIHRKCPGLFWDSVSMDDPEQAFIKVRGIVRNIVNAQKNINPMFDIDFANLSDYPTVQKRLISIRNQIAPQQLFY